MSTEAAIAAAEAGALDKTRDFNARYGVVLLNDQTRVVALRSEGWPHPSVVPQFFDPVQLRRFYSNIRTMEGGRIVGAFDLWMNQRDRRTYEGVEFAPRADLVRRIGEPAPMPDTPRLNLYQGYLIDGAHAHYLAAPATAAAKAKPIIEHIGEVLCSGDASMTEYVFDWLALMLQQPGRQGRTALVFISPEGAGKDSIFTHVFAPLLGVHYYSETQAEGVTGRFNQHLALAVLAVLNEATFGGDRQHAGMLKALITEPRISMEQKYHPRIMVRNCTHLVVLSNENWAVPVGLSDRRFVFPHVSRARIGDEDYFAGLRAEVDSGGREAFLAWLLARRVTRDIAALPEQQSPRRFEHQVRGATTVQRFFLDFLGSGDPFLRIAGSGLRSDATVRPWRVSGDRALAVTGAEEINWDAEPIAYRKDELYEAYLGFVRAQGGGRAESRELFFREAYQHFPGLMAQRRMRLGEERAYCVELPALAQAREMAAKAIRGRPAWQTTDPGPKAAKSRRSGRPDPVEPPIPDFGAE